MKKVLVDMDGTSYDFPSELYNRIQQDTSLPKKVRQTLADINNRTAIWLREVFDPQEFDLKKLERQIEWLYQTKDFFLSLKPYPGMVETLKDLQDICTVKFCTKPSKQYKAESESAKRESIIRHFGQEFSKSMITTHDKTEIRASVLIDDSPIIVWTEDPERTHILVDQPHNQGMDKPRLYLDRLDERKWVIQQYL